jgi:hypothetical protein
MEFPYTKICGRFLHFPSHFSVVQVRSSFRFYQATVSRVLIPSSHNSILRSTVVIPNVASKSDAEWLALLAGIEYAIEHGEHAVALESSNTDAVQGLIIPGTKFYRQSISQHKQRILTAAEPLDWLGARIISSRQNQAINSQLY